MPPVLNRSTVKDLRRWETLASRFVSGLGRQAGVVPAVDTRPDPYNPLGPDRSESITGRWTYPPSGWTTAADVPKSAGLRELECPTL